MKRLVYAYVRKTMHECAFFLLLLEGEAGAELYPLEFEYEG